MMEMHSRPHLLGGESHVYRFDNGYGAGVVGFDGSYGGSWACGN